MVVYKRKVSLSIGKWLLALAIFVAAMTITWDDVEGASPVPTQADNPISVVQK